MKHKRKVFLEYTKSAKSQKQSTLIENVIPFPPGYGLGLGLGLGRGGLGRGGCGRGTVRNQWFDEKKVSKVKKTLFNEGYIKGLSMF